MSYTDQHLDEIARANNIPSTAVRITAMDGSVVWINPNNTQLINEYVQGIRGRTESESAPGGVFLRLLPVPPPPPPSIIPPPTVAQPVYTDTPTFLAYEPSPPLVSTGTQTPQQTAQNNNTQIQQSIITQYNKTIEYAVIPIVIEILPDKKRVSLNSRIVVQVDPAETPAQTTTIQYNFNVNVAPIEVNISEPLIETAYAFLRDAVNTYIDEERELKTLLNYGNDEQSAILAYRYGGVDQNNIPSIQLKLLQSVPAEIAEQSPVFLSREVAKTVIDKFRVRFAPAIDTTPYLRPKNLSVKVDVDGGKSLSNITLNRLSLQSGSVGRDDTYKNKTFEDEIFRRWYSYDFNSSELNIDFSDYKNFVFYSSAAMRLAAFKEKLYKIEQLDIKRLQFLSSSTYIPTMSLAGAVTLQDQSAKLATEKEDIIRGFDRYEQYLYFTPTGSISPYSASVYYADTEYEYNSIGYWPKNSSGSLLATYDSASMEWYATQLEIAQRYDDFNENNLVNTIPTYIREDDNSGAYITFVSMIGHFFDTIKPYIDKFPEIYSRGLDPNKELSKDLINEIAESFGFKLPTLNATYDLTDNILGTNNETPRRDTAAEIYKRLLHNLPFFAKAKGTKTALEAFLKTFGITPQLISVKEMGTPISGSYTVFDEFSTGLDFDKNKESYIRLPLAASARNPRTLQLNATVGDARHQTLLTGDNRWALNVNVHPSNNKIGRIEIVSGSTSTIIMSSSYYELFGDKIINVTLQNYPSTASLYVRHVDSGEVIYESIVSETSSFVSLWQATQYIYLGGAGPLVTSRYNGTVDEVRLWTDTLSDESILNATYDPGTSAGDTYSSAVDDLIVQLSFNNLVTSSLTASILYNESPYGDKSTPPSLTSFFTFNVSGSDFSRYNRVIRQETPQVGSSGFVVNKVKVADPPVFLSDSQGLRLYRNKSIVDPSSKKIQKGRNKVVLSMSPTEIINQNIIRTFGLENINSVLGAPTTLYTSFDKSLDTLKKYYQQYYYVDVNTNKFIRILSEIGSILDQVVDYFIPSKATVIKGIVIEPNILEQVKIAPIKNISIYGKDTRKTLNAPGSLTGSRPDYGATFNLTQKIYAVNDTTATGSFTTYNTQLQSQRDIVILTGSKNNWSSTLDITTETIDGKLSNYTSSVDIIRQKFVTGSYNSYTTELNAQTQVITGSTSTYKTAIEDFVGIEVSGSYNTYSGSAIDTVPIQTGSYLTFNKKHETWNYNSYQTGSVVSGSNKPQRQSFVDLGLANLNKFKYNPTNYGKHGSEPFNRLYTRKLFESEIITPRGGGTASLYEPALKEIPPTADFRDFGVYTYFSDPEGIYYFSEIIKNPAYNTTLNQSWDQTNQQFIGITTWSYGVRYNQHDVVYQDIKYTDLQQLGSLASSSITYGNKLYYVFKTKSLYKPPVDGTAFNSGSVPSYTPPSLDKENWEVLRFAPSQKRVPKRVVFDTFTVVNPSLNNFKTTTISIDKLINIPDRYIDEFDILSVESGSYSSGEITVNNIAILFGLQVNTGGLRVRLYRTAEKRDADLSRLITTRPSNDHGVLLDTEINVGETLEITNPFLTLVAGKNPPGGKIYYTVNNLTSTQKSSIKLLLYYFAVELEPRIPFGYLRKHYRFFRDNSTATKRRNYEGCKNDQTTTIDGLPAVQVFISEGTDLIRSSTQTNTEIITGGGGTLNAT